MFQLQKEQFKIVVYGNFVYLPPYAKSERAF